ncbi:hypothetical protein LINGRAHAP2_LOCUS9536 [Linum grandiflorum]
MARLLLLQHGSIVCHGFGSWPPMPLSIGLFVAVAVLAGLCAHAPTTRNSSKKLITKTMSLKRTNPSAAATQKKSSCSVDDHEHEIRVDISAQVPLPLLPPPPARSQVPLERRGSKEDHVSTKEKKGKVEAKMAAVGGGFGEDGLWQKSILRGEKCQPPEFSGVIFYDSKGNQIEITR